MSLSNLSSSNSSGAFLDYGEFRSGVYIQTPNQILYFTDNNGNRIGYQWKGLLPHTTSTNDPNTDGGISDTAWSSVVSTGFFEKLSNEGINLDWRAHLPTIEVSYNLPHKSLKVWVHGLTSTINDYWLYSPDGTVWGGVGVLGNTPDAPFKQITPQNNIIEWTTVASEGQNQFTVPYNFTNISVYINGLLQNKSTGGYVVNGSTVTLNGFLKAGDVIHTVIANVPISNLTYVLKDELLDYVSKADLLNTNATSNISTKNGGLLVTTIPEFYAEEFGVDHTGLTDASAAIQRALMSINNQLDSTYNGSQTKYAKLIFGNGKILAKDLLIKSNITIEGQGVGNTIFIPAEGGKYVWDTVGTEPYTTSGSAKRLFRPTFRNFSIGCGYQNKFNNVNIPVGVGGIRIAHASYVTMENLEFRYLDGKALVLESLWDSYLCNIRIMYCGNATNQSDIKWAIDLGPGNDLQDGSNANRFYGIHIEGCPAMLHVGLRSRHNFFIGGKFESIRMNDVNTYSSCILEGVDGLVFTDMEFSWSNVGRFMFKAIGTTTMNDTSDNDVTDYNNDHSRGIVFANTSIIDSQSLPGDYFQYSSSRGPLVISGGYARHARYLVSGSNIHLRGFTATQCGPIMGYLQNDNIIEDITVYNQRVLASGTFDVFTITGSNNFVKNSRFGTNYGSATNGSSWFALSAAADVTFNDIIFSGKMQYGIRGNTTTAQWKKMTNVILSSDATYGELVQGGYTFSNFQTRTITNTGGGITSFGTAAVDTLTEFKNVIGGSAMLSIRIENSSSIYLASGVILADAGSNSISILGNLSNNLSSTGTGTSGDGKLYLSSSNGSLFVTNRTSTIIRVYITSINAKI